MLVNNSSFTKISQLKSIGLTLYELDILSSIIYNSYSIRDNLIDNKDVTACNFMKNSNFGDLINIQNFPAYEITYNISPEEIGPYNMIHFNNSNQDQPLGDTTQNPIYIMKNSLNNQMNNRIYSEGELIESTNSSRKNTAHLMEEGRLTNSSATRIVSGNKIGLLRKVLSGIHDDYQILITSKPKNKSNKIRKSNRHSRYRGVSLNGKKWQVMIMGPIKKKYFGGIPTEREAAVFYDKLSILTNGLAAKTNFNYRKSDLMQMMNELEYMESQIS